MSLAGRRSTNTSNTLSWRRTGHNAIGLVSLSQVSSEVISATDAHYCIRSGWRGRGQRKSAYEVSKTGRGRDRKKELD
jgi:hypothetical protein